MQIIKQLIEKKYESWFIAKKNGNMNFYDFFSALSLASTYNKLNNLPHLSEDDIDYRDKLYGVYSFEALKYLSNNTSKLPFDSKTQWLKYIKNKRNIILSNITNELIRLIAEDEKIIITCIKSSSKDEKREVKEPMKFKDLNQNFIIGVVKRKRM